MKTNEKDSLAKRIKRISAGFYILILLSAILLAAVCFFGSQIFLVPPSLKTYLILAIIALVVFIGLLTLFGYRAVNKLNNIGEEIFEIIDEKADKVEKKQCDPAEIDEYNELLQKIDDFSTPISVIVVLGCLIGVLVIISMLAAAAAA